MKKDSFAHKTLKNISYSFLGYGWNLFLALFITPIIVFKLGVDNYGVYIFINTVVSIVGLIDAGFSTAVSKYFSEYSGAQKKEELKNLIYSANTAFLFIGLVGFFVFWGIGEFGQIFTSASAMSVYNIKTLFLIAGISFFVNAVNSVFVIALPALQRFDIYTKMGMFQLTASSLSVLLAVVSGFGLIGVFLTQLFFNVVFSFMTYYYANKVLPDIRFKFSWHKEEMKKSYKFALTAFVSNISGQTLAYFDKLVIPIFISPISLSYYSLAGSVASKSTSTISSLTSVLFPAISHLHGSGDQEAIKRLYIRSFRLTMILNVAITLSISFFSYKIMSYWLDESFAIKASGVLIVLVATHFFISLYGQLNNFLLGLGRVKIMSTFSLLMAVLNMALLLVFLPLYGILGAAWAYLFSLLPTIYIAYYIEKGIFNLENRLAYYAKFFSKLVVTGLVFYFLCVFLINPLAIGFKTLLFLGPLAVLTYLGLYGIFGFYEREDVLTLKGFGLLVFERIGLKK